METDLQSVKAGYSFFGPGFVAHLGERFAGSEEVEGSNPSGSTTGGLCHVNMQPYVHKKNYYVSCKCQGCRPYHRPKKSRWLKKATRQKTKKEIKFEENACGDYIMLDRGPVRLRIISVTGAREE